MFSANAQESKTNPSIKEKAEKNILDIIQVMDIPSPEVHDALLQVFEKKYTLLSKENITDAEKDAVSKLINSKLHSIINNEDIIKQLVDKDLYKGLISE